MANLFLGREKYHGQSAFLLLLLVAFLAVFLAGGLSLTSYSKPATDQYVPISKMPIPGKDSLQLDTLKFKKCQEVIAVDLLIDTSGSMQFGNKMPELKNALSSFVSLLSDKSLIAMQTFSTTTQNVLPFSFYKDSKNQLASLIGSLTPNGATYTRDAFLMARDEIRKAQSAYPKYKFRLIFVSDGIPETMSPSPNATCKVSPVLNIKRCLDWAQDPNRSPSVADDLKNMGVRIYTIAVLDHEDAIFNPELESILKQAASPGSFYLAPTASDLKKIYSQIGSRLCQ